MSKSFKPRYGDILADPLVLQQWLDTITQLINQEPQPWTPQLTFTTPGDLAVVYSTQLGYAWRLGNIVVAIGSLVTSTFTYTTAAGNNRITGFPVAAKAGTGLVQVGTCLADGWTKANYTQAELGLSSGSTIANLRLAGSGQPLFIATTAEMPSGTQQTRHFCMTYFTD